MVIVLFGRSVKELDRKVVSTIGNSNESISFFKSLSESDGNVIRYSPRHSFKPCMSLV